MRRFLIQLQTALLLLAMSTVVSTPVLATMLPLRMMSLTVIRGEFVAPHQGVKPETTAIETFAMVMSSTTSAVVVGSVYPVQALSGDSVTLTTSSGTVNVPVNTVRTLTVSPMDRPPVPLVNGKVVLGFSDGTTASYVQNTAAPISILSPLSYFITDQTGALSGHVSPDVSAAAHARGEQVWPIVEAGFDPSRTTAILADPIARFQLLQGVVERMITDNADGVNLDFEDMIPADAARLTALTADFATVLHAMGRGISVDVTPPSSDPNWGAVYDRAALSKVADFEVVMTYDEHYGGDPVAGSVASLPWTNVGVAHTIALGVSPSRLLLGVPLYVRDWYTDSQGHLTSSYIGVSAVAALQAKPGAHTTYDPTTRQDVLTYPLGGVLHTVWLEDDKSLSERGQLVANLHLAGVGIWQLNLGSIQNVKTLTQAFLRSSS